MLPHPSEEGSDLREGPGGGGGGEASEVKPFLRASKRTVVTEVHEKTGCLPTLRYARRGRAVLNLDVLDFKVSISQQGCGFGSDYHPTNWPSFGGQHRGTAMRAD